MLTMLTLLRVMDKRNKPNLPISAFLLCFCTLVLAGNLASLRDQEAQRPKSKNAYSCQTTFKRNWIKVTKKCLILNWVLFSSHTYTHEWLYWLSSTQPGALVYLKGFLVLYVILYRAVFSFSSSQSFDLSSNFFVGIYISIHSYGDTLQNLCYTIIDGKTWNFMPLIFRATHCLPSTELQQVSQSWRQENQKLYSCKQ